MRNLSELRSFILQVQQVCPWGRAALLQDRCLVANLRTDELGQVALRQALRRFVKLHRAALSPSALVLALPRSHAMSFEQFSREAGAAFGRYIEAALDCYQPALPQAERRRRAAEQARMEIDPTCPIRPHVQLDGEATSITALGPVYPETHPRFAPIPCLVVLWLSDVASIPDAARVRVRAQLLERTGVVYDADDLVLPLQPLPATRNRA